MPHIRARNALSYLHAPPPPEEAGATDPIRDLAADEAARGNHDLAADLELFADLTD